MPKSRSGNIIIRIQITRPGQISISQDWRGGGGNPRSTYRSDVLKMVLVINNNDIIDRSLTGGWLSVRVLATKCYKEAIPYQYFYQVSHLF